MPSDQYAAALCTVVQGMARDARARRLQVKYGFHPTLVGCAGKAELEFWNVCVGRDWDGTYRNGTTQYSRRAEDERTVVASRLNMPAICATNPPSP
ncbi:hypothetical protein AURDEDRAFT_165898 [Auricularia subglabra TFB-10046 SS5]|nr:hypothetical protein AURDEDRAFT_165898 [Auricularia subglabra TFB-10046 SS5]